MMVCRALFAFLLISCSALFAVESTIEGKLLDPIEPKATSSVGPFKVHALTMWSSKAKFKKEPSQKSSYARGEADVSYTYEMATGNKVFAELGYALTHLKWNGNIFFNHTNFSYTSLVLGGSNSTVLNRWVLEASAQACIDNRHVNFDQYARYVGQVKGRYEFLPEMGVHIGVIGESGLRKNQLTPILGFDYKIEQWKVNVVYPTNLAVSYALTECLDLGLEYRFFRSRHRLDSNDPVPNGIFQYRANGLDLFAKLDAAERYHFEGFAGYKFAGDLKIMDGAGRTLDNNFRHFKGSMYVGVDLSVTF